MRTAFKAYGSSVHLTRIENSVSDGFPDVEYTLLLNGLPYWAAVELKTAARPKLHTSPVQVKFRPAQIPWLRKRWAVRGSAWALVQVGSGKDLARYLIPGDQAGIVAEGVVEDRLRELSACREKDPLDRIIRIAAVWRSEQFP